MVESRGLSGFEKNVILALIGSIIQPNKVHSMHTVYIHAYMLYILYTAHPSMHYGIFNLKAMGHNIRLDFLLDL